MNKLKCSTTKYPYCLIMVLLLVTAGCAPVYTPSARHTHLLDEKGEASAAVYTGTNGVDIQGAYAFSDHWGMLGAASFGKQEDDDGNKNSLDSDYHKHAYGELGATYFTKIGKIGRFEGLAGFGLGSGESVNNYKVLSSQELKATGSYNKAFLQGNIGLETGIVETGLALRLSQVSFSDFEVSGTSYDNGLSSGTFVEPAAFARLGWELVKLELQLGFNAPLQDDLRYDYDGISASLGLQFNFNTKP